MADPVLAVALALAAAEAEDARGRTTAPEERAPGKARQRPKRDIAPSRTAPVLFVDWLVDICPSYLVAGKRRPPAPAAAPAAAVCCASTLRVVLARCGGILTFRFICISRLVHIG